MKIKLLATSRKVVADGVKRCYALVAPFLIGEDTPLYGVNGVYNSILVHGNMLGYAMFYGAGAGSLPTASAVVSDVVDEVRHLGRTLVFNWNPKDLELASIENDERRFFVRVKDAGELPETKHVAGSNFVDIGVCYDKRLQRAVVVSALDNIVKGAAGQAVQNMNLLFGLDEKTALDHAGFYL